jgi:hypothetical protein
MLIRPFLPGERGAIADQASTRAKHGSHHGRTEPQLPSPATLDRDAKLAKALARAAAAAENHWLKRALASLKGSMSALSRDLRHERKELRELSRREIEQRVKRESEEKRLPPRSA